MSPFSRELLRRLSLGLPIAELEPAAALLTALSPCAPCPLRTRLVGRVARVEVEPAAAALLGGRAPAGLRALPEGASTLGARLAQAAWLERASVFAFEELAHELGLHGAPRALVRRAWAAAEDERRHARLLADLAEREGARVPAVERTPCRPRTLAAIAEDNAVEGLGREAFGALVAAHQARHAEDEGVAAASAVIAPDEARHALLSADVEDWAGAKLGRGAVLRCDELRRAMLSRLARGAAEDGDARLGLPDAATRARFAVALA